LQQATTYILSLKKLSVNDYFVEIRVIRQTSGRVQNKYQDQDR